MKVVDKLLTSSTIPRWEYTCYFVPESEICKCEKQNLFKFIFHFFSFRDLTKSRLVILTSNKTFLSRPVREIYPAAQVCQAGKKNFHPDFFPLLKKSASVLQLWLTRSG